MAAAARILVNMHEVKTLKGQNSYLTDKQFRKNFYLRGWLRQRLAEAETEKTPGSRFMCTHP